MVFVILQELHEQGFCDLLDTIHDVDISMELLCTLSKYQLQAILRSAQNATPSPIGTTPSSLDQLMTRGLNIISEQERGAVQTCVWLKSLQRLLL